jgi:hypothetical protein
MERSGNGCPKRPSSDDELGFRRRPMVRWFDPHQLVDTAARVMGSGLWNSYADSREMQALVAAKVYDRSEGDEIWLDYVADLGDGWNPTYTIARLLAQEELTIPGADDLGPLRRGRILVMGGDQVYPVPKRSEYENRLIGPYKAALPCAPDPGPELFAIPGSHDWYDGLINFINIFCRGRSIGGWATKQSRSCFAMKLPHRWWLWGVDLQFGDYLDEAQLGYFSSATKEMEPGDRIILCMAKEVQSGRDSNEVSSDRDLGYLEREVIERAGGRVAVYLKSGRHHYARWEEDDGPRQLITAGGGGAFMHPTHDLAETNDAYLREEPDRFRRAHVYPSARSSKKIRKWVFVLPAYNLPLAAVFGAIYVGLAFMLNLHLNERHRELGLHDLRRAWWGSPTAFVLLLLVIVTIAALVRLAHEASGEGRLLIGVIHSAILYATLATVLVVASKLTSGIESDALSLTAFLCLVAVLGGVGGVLGIAAYLWATNVFGYHGNEAYAPLHFANYKNFLRLHIDGDGLLTIYPVGIDKVVKKWRFDPDAPASAPWLAPVGDDPPACLIEGPIRIKP